MGRRLLAGLAGLALSYGAAAVIDAQEDDIAERTVPLVKSVGCVERDGDAWYLTAATDPEATQYPFSSAVEVEDARRAGLGSQHFQLVGVADFLDADQLLSLHQRADHTAPESVNATGQLAAGRKVAVKGLYITSAEPHRLNLTSVFALADMCG